MGRPKIDTEETQILEEVVRARRESRGTGWHGEWDATYYEAVRACLSAGITPYKIGVLTGNTSSVARRRLIEKATERNGVS